MTIDLIVPHEDCLNCRCPEGQRCEDLERAIRADRDHTIEELRASLRRKASCPSTDGRGAS